MNDWPPLGIKWYYSDSACCIAHGDCRTILPLLPKVDLCLTDPPYLHAHVDGGGFSRASAFYRDGKLNGLQDFDLSSFGKLLIESSPMLVSFHSRDLIAGYVMLATDNGRKYDLHVWYKIDAIPFTANTWKSDLEYIALIWSKKPGWKQLHQSMHSKVYASCHGEANDCDHPAGKPLKLMRKYIEVLDAQTILDPFMGSGTTLRAAKDLGRRAIGIEIEERYCEIAARRLAQEVLPLNSPAPQPAAITPELAL